MPVDPSKLTTKDRVGYFCSNLFLRSLISLVSCIPYRWRVPTMGKVVAAAAPFVGYEKRIRNNLAIARPDLSEDDIKRICQQVPNNAGRTLVELYAGAPFIERAKQAEISGPGLSALEDARAAGKPVILMTGHFGNYDAARAGLIARGHEMGALYRRMANPYFNDHYVRTISKIGMPLFEQGRRGMSQMVRHLKAGGIIAIVGDLHAIGGRDLTFFGQPAVTSVVPAELALKYNAVIIPVYSIRLENGLDFRVVMMEPIEPSDPETMTQSINDGLESLVRDHMGQWFWIHRRWKRGKGLAATSGDH